MWANSGWALIGISVAVGIWGCTLIWTPGHEVWGPRLLYTAGVLGILSLICFLYPLFKSGSKLDSALKTLWKAIMFFVQRNPDKDLFHYNQSIKNRLMGSINFYWGSVYKVWEDGDTIYIRIKWESDKIIALDVKYVRGDYKCSWLRGNVLETFKTYQDQRNKWYRFIICIVSLKELSPRIIRYKNKLQKELNAQNARVELVFISDRALYNYDGQNEDARKRLENVFNL